MLLAFPIELRSQIAEYLSPEDARNLRLVCKELLPVGNAVAFRTWKLWHRKESTKKFAEFVAKGGSLLVCVEELVIDTNSEQYEDHYTEEQDLRSSFVKCLSKGKLSNFPRLSVLTINFHTECATDDGSHWAKEVPETDAFRRDFLEVVLKAVYDAEARNCRNIKKLNVRGLQNVNEKEIVESEAFKALMSQLTILELYIVTEYEDACPENSYDKPELFTFFEELPSIWLEPTVSNLSTLTLYCDNIFGWCPLLDLRNVHFPQLKNLHLGNYSFTMDWQFDWILSHSTTLKKLTFDDCPITYHMRIPVNGAREQEMYSVNEFKDVERPENPSDYWILKYNKRWNSVFDLFRAKLTNLEVFIFGHTRSWGSGIPWRATARRRLKSVMYAEMYMTFDKGLGPSPWINQKWHFDVPEDGEYPFKVCKKEDKMALEELMEDVKRRSGVKYRPIIEIDAEEDEMSDREEDDKEDEAIYITRMERAKAQPEEDDSDSEDSEDSENDG